MRKIFPRTDLGIEIPLLPENDISVRIVSPFNSVSYTKKYCAAQYGLIEVSLDSFSCQWVDFVDHIVARKIFSLKKFHNILLILQNYYY